MSVKATVVCPAGSRTDRHLTVPVVGLLVGAGTAGAAMGAGATRADRPLQLAGAVVCSITLVVGGRLLSSMRGALPAVAFVASLLLVSGIVGTATGVAVPASSDPDRGLLYTPTGIRVEVYFHGEPGGPELAGSDAPPPMRSGRGYEFSCGLVVERGGLPETWLRSRDGSGWVAATAVRTATGRIPRALPDCEGAGVGDTAVRGSRSVQAGVTGLS